MCVAGHCRDERSRPSCWSILGTSAERSPSNDRVARSIWRHRWFGSLETHNKLFLWYLTRSAVSPFSDEVQFLGIIVLRAVPRTSLALYVIVDDPLFVPGDYLLQKKCSLFFSSSMHPSAAAGSCRFVWHSHIHSTYIGCVPLFTASTANSISSLLFTEC